MVLPQITLCVTNQQVQQSFATSLRNLRTEYVDSLVLHSPLSTHEACMEGGFGSVWVCCVAEPFAASRLPEGVAVHMLVEPPHTLPLECQC
jgi:hypothetical protein